MHSTFYLVIVAIVTSKKVREYTNTLHLEMVVGPKCNMLAP